MQRRRVLFLDDDDDLRDTFVEFIAESFDGECLALRSYEELVAHRAQALSCDLAILDVNLGADVRSGIDGYRWLRGEGFRGPIVFLTGHANSHPLVADVRRIGDAIVVTKPASMATLGSVLNGSVSP